MGKCLGCGRVTDKEWCSACVTAAKEGGGLKFLLPLSETVSLTKACTVEKNQKNENKNDEILADIAAQYNKQVKTENVKPSVEKSHVSGSSTTAGATAKATPAGTVGGASSTAASNTTGNAASSGSGASAGTSGSGALAGTSGSRPSTVKNAVGSASSEREASNGIWRFVLLFLALGAFNSSYFWHSWGAAAQWIFGLAFGIAMIVSGVRYLDDIEHLPANVLNTLKLTFVGLFVWMVGPSYSLAAGLICTGIAVNAVLTMMSSIDFSEILHSVWSAVLLVISVVMVVWLLPWQIGQWCIFAVVLCSLLVLTFAEGEVWSNVIFLIMMILNIVMLKVFPYNYTVLAKVNSVMFALSSLIASVVSFDNSDTELGIAYVFYTVINAVTAVILIWF